MGVYVNDNGTLREITRAFVNDNGVLREVPTWYVNDNGTLRTIFLRQVLFVGANKTSSAVDPDDCIVGWRATNAGLVQSGVGTSSVSYATDYTWLISGAAGDYEISAAVGATNGNGSLSGAIGSFQALSGTRTWELSMTTFGTATRTLNMTVRRVSDQVVLSTFNVVFSSTVDA